MSSPAKNLAEVKRRLSAAMPTLERRFGVASLGIFGSWARHEQEQGSDLDVLVRFSATPGLFRVVELEQELTDLLGIKVDLVLESALKPRIGQRVRREVQAI